MKKLIFQVILMENQPYERSCCLQGLYIFNKAGRTRRVDMIMKLMQMVSSLPILAVPAWCIKDSIPKLIMVVKALNNTARDVLVSRIWVSAPRLSLALLTI